MKTSAQKPSIFLVVIAFAIVYVVWGSTYFFIQMAIHGFPPMLMGALRFFTAGILLLTWCYIKGDKIWAPKNVLNSCISGLLTLFIATGVVIWVEKTLPSSIVAIMVSANPIWFVVLDKANRKVNLGSKTTIGGIVLGFAGVLLLFGEAISKSLAGSISAAQLSGLLLLLISPVAWCGGSLFSKKRGSNSPARLNTAWQMIIAGLAFIPAGFAHNEYTSFHFSQVPLQAWVALIYLIIFGSIGAFSAYVWLLSVKPATQVSTHSYINPVIAVLLGVLFAHEHLSGLQFFGLIVILSSVLLVNINKYKFKMPRFFIKQSKIETCQHI
ncbi:EamA family transporter [Mucilaginibacter gotjawali]|uniref:Drug/metabolite transporter (DMT)-like permease n=2 Tax=Mucilaginibacter gotjawali TaxID=1550579 RepID=A0A839SNZ7_9SPHI|nr:EamA family transporter [Mucilaginibacter gotjawali]MBB3058570.1 drug/metabolite transporter (DMT)-like permease [Mucilaginibacter gotjawali]BAU52464.1 putative inner membrane transporter YedA [Mucilaginibacter gotjawali]